MTIRQTTAFLTDLFAHVEQGRLAPAAFQRPYVWEREHVQKFWTSLMRGYPVGSVLTWVPPAGVDLSRLGRSRIGPLPTPAGPGTELVLDGQNRLASFAWSLLDLAGVPGAAAVEARFRDEAPLSEAERRTWLSGDVLAADPGAREVGFHPRATLAGRLLVPVAVLARPGGLMPFLRAWEKANGEVSDDHLTWLGQGVERRIHDARITLTRLDGLPPGEALEAYRHIAQAGVPMSDADFRAALAFALPD